MKNRDDRGLTDFLWFVAGGVVTSVIASLITARIIESMKPSTVTAGGPTTTVPKAQNA